MLRKYDIPMNKVYVFVPKDEIQDYTRRFYVPMCRGINLIEGKKGLQAQRNYISKFFEEDQLIVEIDDDIININKLKISKLGRQQLKVLPCLETLIYETNLIFEDAKINCAGIYPVKNKLFMKNSTSYTLSYLTGSFRIFRNIRLCEERVFHLMEDYEVSLKYYLRDKGILRYNNICVNNEYNSEYYDLIMKEKKFEIMVFSDKYSDYCFTKKRNDILDLQFKKKICI